MRLNQIVLAGCIVFAWATGQAQIVPNKQVQIAAPNNAGILQSPDVQIMQLKTDVAKLKADLAELKASIEAQKTDFNKHTHDFVTYPVSLNTTAAKCGDPDVCKQGIFYEKAVGSKSVGEVGPPHYPSGKGGGS